MFCFEILHGERVLNFQKCWCEFDDTAKVEVYVTISVWPIVARDISRWQKSTTPSSRAYKELADRRTCFENTTSTFSAVYKDLWRIYKKKRDLLFRRRRQVDDTTISVSVFTEPDRVCHGCTISRDGKLTKNKCDVHQQLLSNAKLRHSYIIHRDIHSYTQFDVFRVQK